MPALRPMPALMVLLALTDQVSARDLDGRYVNSPLKQWFETLASKKGLCCSDADARRYPTPIGNRRMAITAYGSKAPGMTCLTMPSSPCRTASGERWYGRCAASLA